jgi:hypothetical protein
MDTPSANVPFDHKLSPLHPGYVMTVCAVAVPKNAAQATSVDSKLGILSEGRGGGGESAVS